MAKAKDNPTNCTPTSKSDPVKEMNELYNTNGGGDKAGSDGKVGGVKSSKSGTDRLIPGKEGVVTGDSSKKLGENLFRAMGLKPNTSRKGYQAQHIIPKSLSKHPVLKKIGMDLDDASNGIFLRERRTGGSSVLSCCQDIRDAIISIMTSLEKS